MQKTKDAVAVAAPATAPTESDIRRFLESERLGYQRIELPFGLATPGSDRRQAKDVAFSGSLAGKTVLDVGSYLGAFCIEALTRGAARAVGLEPCRDRVRQAREVARFLGLEPEYIQGDIEDQMVTGPFDITLCLNVLHHLRDPIAVLRRLALETRERLIIEVASLGKHDARKHWARGRRRSLTGFARRVSSLLAAGLHLRVLQRYPVAFVGPYVPSALLQSYFFTPGALRRILDGHMRLFQEVEVIPSEFKGRFLLRCTRLQIDHLVVVAGTWSSGTTELCDRIVRNELSSELGWSDMERAVRASQRELWRAPTKQTFPSARCANAVFDYDLSMIDRFPLHGFGRDPATDVLRCARHIDVMVVVPKVETLLRRAAAAGSAGKRGDDTHRGRLQALYKQPGYLAGLYGEWFDFCGRLVPQARFVLSVEGVDGPQVIRPTSAADAKATVARAYGQG